MESAARGLEAGPATAIVQHPPPEGPDLLEPVRDGLS
jgi:hypothetical protein